MSDTKPSESDPREPDGERRRRRTVLPILDRLNQIAFYDLKRAGDQQSSRPLEGAIWVVVAMLLLACLVGIGRHAAREGLDPFQVLFFRNAFCVLWMAPLLVWRGRSMFATGQLKLYGLRVALSYIAMTGMFHAVALIPIGEVTAIGFLSPIFGTVFAVLLLSERVGWRRITALGVGFIGAMIMLRPGFGETVMGAGQAFALMSAITLGLIGPIVKKMTQKDDPDRVVFLTNLFVTPISLIPALFVWQWPEPQLWPWLAAMGLTAVLGHMALVRGYAATDASLVMTYKFVRLPFAVLIGYLAFSETIDAWAWIGAAVVFAASAYIAQRERRLQASRSSTDPSVQLS